MLYLHFFALYIISPAWADTVVLKSGKKIEGTVISESSVYVRIKTQEEISIQEFLMDNVESISIGESSVPQEEPVLEPIKEEETFAEEPLSSEQDVLPIEPEVIIEEIVVETPSETETEAMSETADVPVVLEEKVIAIEPADINEEVDAPTMEPTAERYSQPITADEIIGEETQEDILPGGWGGERRYSWNSYSSCL